MPKGMVKHSLAKGFTLVEMVVTIVILAIALVTVAMMVRQGAQQSANVTLETRAIALGNAYLDEVLGRRFDERSARSGLRPCFGLGGGRRCTLLADFGPDFGETRNRFDDVDDYHGLVEGDGEVNPLQDAEGITRNGYENFNIAINVRYAGTDAQINHLASSELTHAKLITVTVSHRAQNTGWDFSVYRANF